MQCKTNNVRRRTYLYVPCLKEMSTALLHYLVRHKQYSVYARFRLFKVWRKICYSDSYVYVVAVYMLLRRGSTTLGQGRKLPQTSALSLKCDMKHLTNSKHRHMGAECSSLAFKIRQNAFRGGLSPGPGWGTYDTPPDPLVGWGEDTLSHTPPH